MKPPPHILLALLLLAGGANSNADETEKNNSESNDDEPGNVILIYVGKVENEYVMLYCYEKIVSNDKKHYTSVLKSLNWERSEVTIKGLDCSTEEALNMFHLYYMKSDEKEYLVLENKASQQQENYDWPHKTPEISTNVDSNDRLRSQPSKELLKWSKLEGYDKPNCERLTNEEVISVSTLDEMLKTMKTQLEKVKTATFGETLTTVHTKAEGDVSAPTLEEIAPSFETKVEYLNGGNERIKLTFYEVSEEIFYVTISNLMDEHLLTLKNLRCFYSEVMTSIYVEFGENYNLIVIGKYDRDYSEDICWYSVHRHEGNMEHIYRHSGNQPKRMVAQWYKDKRENCPAFKRENIITGEREMAFDVEDLKSVYVLERLDNVLSLSLVEYFLTQCYCTKYSEDNKEKKCESYTLVIGNMDGHVASIKDFGDCSTEASTPINKKMLMLTFNDSKSRKAYVAIISRTTEEEGWCRYDICVNCEAKEEIRNNIDTLSVINQLYKWTRPGIKTENSLSPKSQVPNVDDGLLHVAKYEPKFVTQCLLKPDNDGLGDVKHIVVRNEMGIYLFQTSSEKCLIDQQELVYVLIHKKDGTKVLKKLEGHLPRGDESCWYYGCQDTTAIGTWIFIAKLITPFGMYRWRSLPKRFIEIKRPESCPELKMNSNGVTEQANLKNTKRAVAKYKNSGQYELHCSQDSVSNRYFSDIYDSKREHIATLQDHDCSSIDKLNGQFDVFIPERFVNDKVFKYVVIGISLPFGKENASCSYVICRNCEVNKSWYYLIGEPTYKSDWTKEAETSQS